MIAALKVVGDGATHVDAQPDRNPSGLSVSGRLFQHRLEPTQPGWRRRQSVRNCAASVERPNFCPFDDPVRVRAVADADRNCVPARQQFGPLQHDINGRDLDFTLAPIDAPAQPQRAQCQNNAKGRDRIMYQQPIRNARKVHSWATFQLASRTDSLTEAGEDGNAVAHLPGGGRA